MIPTFRRRFAESVNPENMNGFITELEETFAAMLGPYHAPIMVPRVTIDAGSPTFAATNTGWTALKLATTGSVSSTTFATILSYTGRGVLRMLAAGQVSGVGGLARTAGIRLTVDDNVIYEEDTTLITAQSQAKVIVGYLNTWSSSSAFTISDDPVGIPFNKSLLIEGQISTGVDTLTAGWRLSKKL